LLRRHWFWQGTSWNAITHNPSEQPEDFIKPWFEYYKNMLSFFEKYPYNQYHPIDTNTAYCMTNDKGIFLFFVPKEHYQISIYGSAENAKTGTCQWFNTLTGEYSKETKFKDQFFENPWHIEADAILISIGLVPRSSASFLVTKLLVDTSIALLRDSPSIKNLRAK